MKIFYRFVVGILISFCFIVKIGPAVYSAPTENQVLENSKIKSLQAILESVGQLEEEIKKKRKALKPITLEGERRELEQDISNLTSQIRSLEDNFAEIASGVDIELFQEVPPRKFDWSEELKDILKPILDDIRSMTASPREIDRLQRETQEAEKRLSAAQKARANIGELIKATPREELKTALVKLEKQWLILQQQLEAQRAIAGEQLKQKRAEKRTLSETMQELSRIFFKSRGRNLLLALLAFFGAWIILWKFHEGIKRTQFHQRMRRTFSARLFDLVYHIISFLIALLALLAVLYLMGDWVLLTLVLIILFGMIWASRHAVPRFWEQAKLLLNMGAVREGERLVYKGLPWHVKSIGFYSRLINKELSGGEIRLPLRHLLDLNSRPTKEHEPWFPCKQDDWVLLSENTHGKVVIQTPEIVELILLGGSHKTFRVDDFLAQNPINLCPNFRIKVSFGLDYQHQSIITEKIPGILEALLKEKLTEEGYGDDMNCIKIEFGKAGASSLDVEVLADFSGRVGGKYFILQRAIQRICVDACNTYGWVIPFTQLTVHMPSPNM